MGLCAPWGDYKNKQLFAKPFTQHVPILLKTWITWWTALKKINVLISTDAMTKPAPSPWPYTSLQGKQICMSSLYTDHW